MKIVMEGVQKLSIKQEKVMEQVSNNNINQQQQESVTVLYCGVCRTDAKMFYEGDKNLILPRVLGHEIVCQKENSEKLYTVWPAKACGYCENCLKQKNNLCHNIQIMGFHCDGGFSNKISVIKENLILIPHDIPPYLGVFAEPLGCVLNAVNKIEVSPGKSVLIYGGGTLGLITALMCKHLGMLPIIIEVSTEKQQKIQSILDKLSINCCYTPSSKELDLAINTCASPDAFTACINNIKRGGELIFFSGLKKNETLTTSLINLIHYKELTLRGAYGLTKKNMHDALDIINVYQDIFFLFVSNLISPFKLPEYLDQVYHSQLLKVIIDFKSNLDSP